jgi:hypothetical protein
MTLPQEIRARVLEFVLQFQHPLQKPARRFGEILLFNWLEEGKRKETTHTPWKEPREVGICIQRSFIDIAILQSSRQL